MKRVPVHCAWATAAAIVLVQSHAISDVGIVDINDKASEIRWAAAIHSSHRSKLQPSSQDSSPQGSTQGSTHREVRLRICTDPIQQWDNSCEDTPLVSDALSEGEWLKRVKAFLNLDRLEKADPSLAHRQLAIQWTRDRVREKLDIGSLTSVGKEQLENSLNLMLDTVEPSHRDEELALRNSVLKRWIGWISNPTPTFDDILFKGVEPLAVDAALSPFSNWIFHSVCRCELMATSEAMDEPSCVLKKADKILASSKATVSDCTNRASCADRDWQKDFAKLTEDECDGYYTVGPMLPSLFGGLAEQPKNNGPLTQ